ncbi:type II secretion system protein N [Thauera sp. SDU_THAU2]|uniref:type II secretion system protein N n=1 Tax=Thauera sp. SDU_THAU2 TaxID=3136633 RepID=UPI00311FD0F8
MRALASSPALRALCLTGLVLGFAITCAPASLLDRGLARASEGRLRLSAGHGTLWHGNGLLAERVAGHFNPWVDVAWRFDFGGLWRGRIALALAIDGQAPVRLLVSPRGFDLELPGTSLPLAPLVRTLPHPAARLGWDGKLHARGRLEDCDRALACVGRLQLSVDALSLDVLPDARLGHYRLDAQASAGSLRLVLASDEHNRLNASGEAEVMPGGRSKGGITLDGERELVRQIAAMTADLARPAPDGALRFIW